MVIEEIACDDDEVYVLLDRYPNQLIEGVESRFGDTVARFFIKAGNPHAQMQIARVEKSKHIGSRRRDGGELLG
jgi:hypothetical protein